MKKRHIVITLGLLGLTTFMAGCATNGTAQTTHQSVTELVHASDSSAEFQYLIQFSGGRYHDEALQEYLGITGKRLLKLSGYQELAGEFAVVNNDQPNAWVTLDGRIAISRGMLLSLRNEAELAAIIAHLLVHAGQRHAAKVLERGGEVDQRILEQGSSHPYAQYVVEVAKAALVSHSVVYTSAEEQEADRHAVTLMVKAGYDPQAAVDLQLRSLDISLSSQPLWLRHHGPSQERVGVNRKAAHGQPAGLLMAQRSFDKAMAVLRQEAAAYQQQQQASSQLKAGNSEGAYQQIRLAIAQAPNESALYALEGDALAELNEIDSAIHAYDQAISRSPDYFAYYLRRAELYLEQQHFQQAQADLLKSLQTLPTAKGYSLLAELLAKQGEMALAHDYFQRAALSDTPLGREADRQAKRVDFDANPDRYIHIKPSREGEDVVALFISNLNPYPVELKSMLLVAGQTYRLRLGKIIPGGSSISTKITIKGLGEIQKVTVDQAQLVQ